MSISQVLGAGALYGIGAPLVVVAAVGAAPISAGIIGMLAVGAAVSFLFTRQWAPEYI